MKCPNCQFENPEAMQFWGKCGAKLENICLQCNSSNPSDFRFCGKCGHDLAQPQETLAVDYSEPQSYTPKFLAEKILTTRSSIEGERKLVTVLFADGLYRGWGYDQFSLTVGEHGQARHQHGIRSHP